LKTIPDGNDLAGKLPTRQTCDTMRDMDCEHRICDYEESTYRTDFWEGRGREYEDLAERIALRRLLPPTGRRLIDIGAGFGRLSEFYADYDQVVLIDYSRSLLRQAQARLGRDGRFVYVAANFYTMPFADAAFDVAMMVRVIHHVEDVPALLGEVARVLSGDGAFVLEFANKCHLKAILRYALRRQQWSPFNPAPYEFVDMNFDFHPTWMKRRLADAMFHVKHTLTVSHFRLPLLKRLVPAPTLATLDGLCQPTGRWWQLTPSIFVHCIPDGRNPGVQSSLRFRCPACSSPELHESPAGLICKSCDRLWPIEDGIYVFKDPTPA
jgi:SAM-dependent methyltransferase